MTDQAENQADDGDAVEGGGGGASHGGGPQASNPRAGSSAPRRLRGERQPREPGNPRLVRHVVRVHPETEQRLVLRAAERRISVARLLVESALAGGAEAAKSKAELAADLFAVQRFLGKVGVNVNQIARVTNATLETQPTTYAAMAAVERVCDRLVQVLDDVEGRL